MKKEYFEPLYLYGNEWILISNKYEWKKEYFDPLPSDYSWQFLGIILDILALILCLILA